MAKAVKGGNITLVALILVGYVLGGVISRMTAGAPSLAFLGYGMSFGMEQPLLLDVGIFRLTFAIMFEINVASIIGIIIAIFIHRKL